MILKLGEILRPEHVLADLRGRTRDDVIAELIAAVRDEVPVPLERLRALLVEREEQSPTAMSGGVAVPHARLQEIDHFTMALGRSRIGVPFGADDGNTNIFFLVLAPTDDTVTHLKILARIARICRNQELRAEIMAAKTGAEIFERLMKEDAGT